MYNVMTYVTAVQGHPRSLISIPIESAYAIPMHGGLKSMYKPFYRCNNFLSTANRLY